MKQHEHSMEAGAADATLEALFRHADARPKAPSDMEAEVRAAVRQEWQSVTQGRRRRRIRVYGMAASLLAAVFLLVALRQPAAPPAATVIAQVEQLEGRILVRRADESPSQALLLNSGELVAGQVLRTGARSRIGLTWGNGESIRLDEDTELVLHAGDRLQLVRGTLYIDSGATNAVRGSFMIDTPEGPVRHLGTQYLASVGDIGVTVSVREGEVQVGNTLAAAGEQLRIEHGTAERSQIETFGPLWQWAEQVTPQLRLDGMSAMAFAEWAARETGRSLVFESGEAESIARDTQLRGAVQLQPERALELILPTSDLQHRVVDGEIRLAVRSGD